MNGYLVVLRGNMDDTPSSLHATLDAAMLAAKLAAKDWKAAVKSAVDKLGEGWPVSSSPNHIAIVRFEDGKPAETVSSIDTDNF
jgi:hypothetical protein